MRAHIRETICSIYTLRVMLVYLDWSRLVMYCLQVA